jgi:hypothetical protein
VAEFDAGKIKALLTKKIGPLPAWAWLAGGGVGIFLARKLGAGGGAADVSSAEYIGDDEGGYPYAASSLLGGGGGGGVPASAPPEPTLPYLPDPFEEAPIPGDAGPFPSTSNAVVPGAPGNCPPGYYWNGYACALKVVAGPAKVQPGAVQHVPGTKRICQKGWHWNGFDCVPDILAPSRKNLLKALRKQGLKTN